MSGTVRQIVDQALTIIGEVSGAGVQTYSDDKMMSYAIMGFNLILKKFPWPHFREWTRHQLDGTLGIVNADAFTNVKDFDDIIAVHRDAEAQPLPILPLSINPYTISSGTQVRYWTSLASSNARYAKRRLQFWPKSATGYVNIATRVYPTTTAWDWQDTMDFDKDLLSYAAAFLTLSFDQINNAAAPIVQGLMDMRMSDITAGLARHPVMVEGSDGIPTQWYER